MSQEGRAITFFDPEKAMWDNSMVGQSILNSTEWFWKAVGTPLCILECTAANEKDHNLPLTS